jgi:hypothetical protein
MRGVKEEMLVHPEQGANVPARGPTARAIGNSGGDVKHFNENRSEKSLAFKYLPPIPSDL